MSNAIVYVDASRPDDTGDGLSEANAKKTIGAALALLSGGGNICYVQAGTSYVLTTTITVTLKGDSTDGKNVIEGYTTTPGAKDGRPTITSATNSVSLFTLQDADFLEFNHIGFTHTAGTRGSGITGNTSASSPIRMVDCIFDGMLRAVHHGNTSGLLGYTMEDCEIKNCTSNAMSGFFINLHGCTLKDNAGPIIGVNGSQLDLVMDGCIVDSTASDAVVTTTTNQTVWLDFRECVFYNSTGSHVVITGNSGVTNIVLINNVFWDHDDYGVESLDTQDKIDSAIRINRCNAYGGAGTGARFQFPAGIGDITLTTDPFTDAPNGDFSYNNAAGGGALLKAAGFPGVMPDGLTTVYKDVGLQQEEAVDGGGVGGGVINGGVIH